MSGTTNLLVTWNFDVDKVNEQHAFPVVGFEIAYFPIDQTAENEGRRANNSKVKEDTVSNAKERLISEFVYLELGN